jgi:hypothetical protein
MEPDPSGRQVARPPSSHPKFDLALRNYNEIIYIALFESILVSFKSITDNNF